MRVGDLSFGLKLSAIIVLCAVTVAALLAGSLGILHGAVLEERRFTAQSAVEVAHSVMTKYAEAEQRGEMTHDAAVEAALGVIRILRYGQGEYFFVSDTQGVMRMHPVKKELEGRNLSDLQDKKGRYFYREFFDKAGQQSGFVTYFWPKPGHEEAVEKVSYVKAFAPWNMMIVSGVYLDDVETRFVTYARQLIIGGVFGLVLIAAAAMAFSRHMVTPLKLVTGAMNRLIAGEEDVVVSACARRDEVGVLNQAVATFSDNSRQMRALEAAAQREKLAAEESKRELMRHLAREIEAEIKGVAKAVASSASDMDVTIGAMAQLAQSASGQATRIVSASARASANVQMVATAAEELSASINEIGIQAANSTKVSQIAADEAGHTNERIAALSDSVAQISEVIQLITDVANQTNLLALNATMSCSIKQRQFA